MNTSQVYPTAHEKGQVIEDLWMLEDKQGKCLTGKKCLTEKEKSMLKGYPGS